MPPRLLQMGASISERAALFIPSAHSKEAQKHKKEQGSESTGRFKSTYASHPIVCAFYLDYIVCVICGWFHDFLSFAACSRMRSSCSLSSGVNSAPKSSASKICRISTSASLGELSASYGMRLTHSIASSIDFTFQIQKPAISSRVSANGPSVTIRFPPENFTRLPLELG